MTGVEVQDGLPFPVLDPVITRNPTVVLVGLPIAAAPLIELLTDAQPNRVLLDRYTRFFRPLVDEINDRIPSVRGNPAAG